MKLPFGLGKGESADAGDNAERAADSAGTHDDSARSSAATQAFTMGAGGRAEPQQVGAPRGRGRRPAVAKSGAAPAPGNRGETDAAAPQSGAHKQPQRGVQQPRIAERAVAEPDPRPSAAPKGGIQPDTDTDTDTDTATGAADVPDRPRADAERANSGRQSADKSGKTGAVAAGAVGAGVAGAGAAATADKAKKKSPQAAREGRDTTQDRTGRGADGGRSDGAQAQAETQPEAQTQIIDGGHKPGSRDRLAPPQHGDDTQRDPKQRQSGQDQPGQNQPRQNQPRHSETTGIQPKREAGAQQDAALGERRDAVDSRSGAKKHGAAPAAAGAAGVAGGWVLGKRGRKKAEKQRQQEDSAARRTGTTKAAANHNDGEDMTRDNTGALGSNDTRAFPLADSDYAYDDPDSEATAYSELYSSEYDHDHDPDYDHTASAGATGGAAGGIARTSGKPPARRGTADFGLLVLRVAVGLMLLLHAMRIVFGSFNGPGLDNYATILGDAGFVQTSLLATVMGVAELVAAAILILGLAIPLATAVLWALVGINLLTLIAVAGKFTLLGGADLSGTPAGGIELHVIYLAALTALLFAGGGRLGLDFSRGWAIAPKWSGIVWLILAIGAVVAVWLLLNGSNPLAATATAA